MRARVQRFTVPVRWAAPQAIAQAVGLGWLYGKAIAGDNGAVRYGYPSISTRAKYAGYAFPPQLFTGYDARKVAAGAIRPDPASYPGDSVSPATASDPMSRALETITLGGQGVMR